MTKARISKKLVAIATTMMLLVAMVIPVAATSQPNTGQITVHKYARSSAGSAHPDNEFSGAQLPTSVTATLGTPLMGAGFTLYRLNTANLDTALAAGHTVTSYGVTGTTVTFNMSGGGPVTALGTAVGAQQFTDAAGETVFGATGTPGIGNLADGYYLLVETTVPGTPGQYTAAAPSVIKLPLTFNNGNSVNRDVHVYPKNVDTTVQTVEKTMAGGVRPINTRDVVSFRISTLFKNTAPAPDNVDNVHDLRIDADPLAVPPIPVDVYGSVVLSDPLASYFTYVDTTTPVSAAIPAGTKGLEVYLVDGAGNRLTTPATTLVAGTDYTVSGITPGTLGPAANIVITLTNAGIDKAIAANAQALAAEFDAVYTGGASAAPGDTIINISNSASSVVTSPTGVTPPIEPPTVFHSPGAAIIVDKLNEASAKFAGATFALAKVAVPTYTYYEATWDSAIPADQYTPAQISSIEAQYVLDSTGKPVSATTNAAGELIFNNIPYTDAGVTYYLVETATQAGYELPSGTIAVTLDSKADLISASSPLLDASDNWISGSIVVATAVINNYPQGTDQSFSLPLTGGAGTLAFTAIGILVMLGAAVVYLQGKKKNA